MKKRAHHSLLSIIYILGLSSLASAGPVEGVEQLTRGAREVVTIGIQFISDVMFDLDSFDEFLFAKIIIFLIIFFVVYVVLRRNDIFGRDKKIAVVITAAITILSVRYLPVEFVEVILLQYNVFAVAVTTLLPLVIFTFFLYQSDFGPFARKAGWALYGIALVSMAAFRYDELGQAKYIYWAGIAMVVIGILFDKVIISQFNQADINKGRKAGYLATYVKNQNKIREMQVGIEEGGAQGGIKRKLEKRIEALEKDNKDLSKHL